MISTKNIPSDRVLNTKKNIMDILFKDINYNNKKIQYTKPYVYKIKKFKKNKIKETEISRNVNNFKNQNNKKNCTDDSDTKDIIVKEDITNENQDSYMILPNGEKRKDMYGNPVLAQEGNISNYDKDILLYKYYDTNQDEPDIDELIKNILKEIQDINADIIDFQKESLYFLNDANTAKEYKKYVNNQIDELKDYYNTIDEPFEKIVKEYYDIIEEAGL